MSARPQHVVFGSGAIGLALTEALQRRGQTGIWLVNRSGSAPVADAVEVVGGDASDATFAVEVAAGARVVYQVLNPRTNSGPNASQHYKPACSLPRKPPAPGW